MDSPLRLTDGVPIMDGLILLLMKLIKGVSV